MFIIDYLAGLRLGWLIKFEYVAMAFFIVGSIASQPGKRLAVKAANYSTIALVLTVFFFRGIVASQALSQGADGKVLADMLNNDFFRVVFYAVLVIFLLIRLIKTCQAEKIRKVRVFNRLAHRKV